MKRVFLVEYKPDTYTSLESMRNACPYIGIVYKEERYMLAYIHKYKYAGVRPEKWLDLTDPARTEFFSFQDANTLLEWLKG